MVAIPSQQNINYKALIWTIGTHLLLLLLFILLRYTVTKPEPVAASGGLEVNLGTSETGSGSNQPLKKENPAEYQATVVYKTAAPKANTTIPSNILQTTDASAPDVNVNKETKKEETTPKDAEQQKPQPVAPPQPRYTYSGETGKGGNGATENKPGGSEGIGKGPGDQGVPNGTPGASNYSGVPGNGSGGIGHTLTGRQISPAQFEAEFKESGKVVIHVTVDRNGAIVNKRVVSSSSPQLTKIAIEKLANARFSKSESTEPQQFGDVTIIFKTH